MNAVLIAVFILSCAFLLYILAGYPVMLALLGRLRPKHVRKEFQRKSVSIVLPVQNGERWIESKLQSIAALNYPRELMEVIVVSDGSTDRTDELVEATPEDNVRLIRVSKSGKASALNAGMQQARGEVLFFTDVRQPLDKDSLMHLVSCLADPDVGVVTGELVILQGETREEADVGLYWRYEKWLRAQLNRVGSLLVVTGCIYAMRRDLATPIPPGTLTDDAYLPMGAFLRGYRIVFEPAAKAFDYPTKLNMEFRRKVRTLAGLFQLIGQYPALLNPFANRMWIDFLSYKLGRLLLPYALIFILIGSFGFPGPWAALLLGAQAVFYLLAFLNAFVPDGSIVKRLTSPIATFVTLIVAAFYAGSILFVPAQELWKETKVEKARGAG